MANNYLSTLLSRLVKVFNALAINYVFVGAVAVIAFARTRTTSDIDVIIDHTSIDLEKFVELLQNNGFDATINDMKNFKDKLHVNFFDKESMFRIDVKGIYSDKDKESINEAANIEFNNIKLRIDSFENLIINKLLFGSQIDIEDALATLTKNYPQIDLDLLYKKANKLGVSEELKELIDMYQKMSS